MYNNNNNNINYNLNILIGAKILFNFFFFERVK